MRIVTICIVVAMANCGNNDMRIINNKQILPPSTLQDTKKVEQVVLKNETQIPMNFVCLNTTSDIVNIDIEPQHSFIIKTNDPIWITNNHFKHGTVYLLKPSDSLALRLGDKGGIKMVPYHSDPIRENELNIFRYINSQFPKSYFQIAIENNFSVEPNKHFWELFALFNQRYKKETVLLNEYLAVNEVSENFAECSKEILKLEYHNKLLNYLFINKRLSQSAAVYKKTFDSVYQIVSSKSPNVPPLYKNVEYSYFVRNVQFVLKQNPFQNSNYVKPLADTLYWFAKRQIKEQDKLDKFLFLIIKEELLKFPQSKKECLKFFFVDCKNEEFKGYIKDIMEANKPHGGNDDVLRNYLDQGYEYEKLIGSLNGNIIYIDIWASWCAPCRKEMPAENELIKKFATQPLQFLFISQDENINAWKKAAKNENLDTNRWSFLLPNFENSKFKKAYQINSIPRYIIIDKKGKVIDADAPRPSDPALIPLLNKLLDK